MDNVLLKMEQVMKKLDKLDLIDSRLTKVEAGIIDVKTDINNVRARMQEVDKSA